LAKAESEQEACFQVSHLSAVPLPRTWMFRSGLAACSLTNGETTMSNIARFNPFTDLKDPFSDDFFKGFALRPVYRLMEGEPQMRLDLTEDDKNFFVKAEIPGVTKEDIKVAVEGNQVSLSAEVKKESEEKEGSKVIRSERYFGCVSRSFTLSESVDQAAATAKYDNGVLQLTLPKKPSGQSHVLKIS
jgi:HSP20 family protein